MLFITLLLSSFVQDVQIGLQVMIRQVAAVVTLGMGYGWLSPKNVA